MGKNILGNYVENLKEFKTATESEDKKKVKYEEDKMLAFRSWTTGPRISFKHKVSSLIL